MSSEIKREGNSAKFDNALRSMRKNCEKYGEACYMRDIGYGSKQWMKEADKLYPKIVELTANKLIEADETERPEIIEQAIRSVGKGILGHVSLEHIKTNFVKDTLLRVLDIIASNKEK